MNIIRFFNRLHLTQGLTRDAILFVLQYIRSNKVRTFLSLLGVTIGIFTIVSIFIVIDSMKQGVTNSLSKLGNNTVYVDKWPWGGGPNYQWWKYEHRPEPSYEDYMAIKNNGHCVASVGIRVGTSTSIAYKDNRIEKSRIIGFTPDFVETLNVDLEK